jgi:hypothetical protein
VRDATRGTPTSNVAVQVAGILRDTTSSDGSYRVVLTGDGDHIVRFAQVGYAALLTGMEYVINGDDASDSLRLDIAWPSVTDLAAAVCGAQPSTGVVIGRVRRPPVSPGTEVIVGWDDHAPDPRRKRDAVSFGGFAVPVHPDGSFLLCKLPRDRDIRLYARLGHMSGPIERLRVGGPVLRELHVEPPGPDDE